MVYLESLLPNPVGPDGEGEWIRISNRGNEEQVLSGWRIEDAGGKTFLLDDVGAIKPGEGVELRQTGIALNNDGDTITLYNEKNLLIDQFVYSEAITEGEIVFSAKRTPSDNSQKMLPQEGAQGGDVLNNATLTLDGVGVGGLALTLAIVLTAIFIGIFKHIPNEEE